MSSLYGSLNVSLASLQAQQAGLDVVTNNIANANTPGYARQRVVFEEVPSTEQGGPGGGVQVQNIESIRNRILELQLNKETQTQAGLSSYLSAAQTVQTHFNDASGAGIQSALSGFFSSLQQLTTDPANIPDRQAVLLSAQNLGQVFNSTVGNLTNQQAGLDSDVTTTVAQVNALSKQIASLNTAVQQGQNTSDAGTIEDQRTQLIRQLSGLIDVSVIPSEHGGLTVATPGGTPLVVGTTVVPLTTQLDSASGHQHVYSQGQDVTSTIQAGQLGGDIQARDTLIPGLLQQLNDLSSGIATAVNAQHHQGTDLNGAAGGDFFVGTTLNVAITDPAKIAASSDGSTGSNGNITALAALGTQSIVAGKQPSDAYATLVSGLGSAISSANAEQDASSLTLQQLQTQRSSVSGVNLDEEASSLIQYQRAYQAATRVASVINDLTLDAINIGGGAVV